MTKTLKTLLLAAMAVAGIATVSASALALTGEAGSQDQVATTDPYEGLPTADGEPVLTPEQEQKAKGLLKTDPVAKRFLSGTAFSLGSIGPWIERDENLKPRLVGATLTVQLSTPRKYPMQGWPLIGYEGGPDELGGGQTQGERYSRSSARFAATGVRSFLIDIDLGRNEVVGIQPDNGGVNIEPSPELQQQAVEARAVVEATLRGEGE